MYAQEQEKTNRSCYMYNSHKSLVFAVNADTMTLRCDKHTIPCMTVSFLKIIGCKSCGEKCQEIIISGKTMPSVLISHILQQFHNIDFLHFLVHLYIWPVLPIIILLSNIIDYRLVQSLVLGIGLITAFHNRLPGLPD